MSNEIEGAMPPLPEPYVEMYREMTPVLYEAWAVQMHAYAKAYAAPLVARVAELRGLLEELVVYDYQETEYDGQMISFCPECGEKNGSHRPNCAFVRARAAIAAKD